MFGCCCMPCTIYSNAESLDQSGILCMLLGCGMPWVATWILRGKAREKYGIDVRTIKHKQILYQNIYPFQGDDMDDLLCACCCTAFVQCQVMLLASTEAA